MRLLNLLRRGKRRATQRIRIDDPTASWTIGEWADLPIHHPRIEHGAR